MKNSSAPLGIEPVTFRFVAQCLNQLCHRVPLSRINTRTFSTPIILHTYLPMKTEQTDCSEMLAYKIQTPGNYPEESTQTSDLLVQKN